MFEDSCSYLCVFVFVCFYVVSLFWCQIGPRSRALLIFANSSYVWSKVRRKQPRCRWCLADPWKHVCVHVRVITLTLCAWFVWTHMRNAIHVASQMRCADNGRSRLYIQFDQAILEEKNANYKYKKQWRISKRGPRHLKIYCFGKPQGAEGVTTKAPHRIKPSRRGPTALLRPHLQGTKEDAGRPEEPDSHGLLHSICNNPPSIIYMYSFAFLHFVSKPLALRSDTHESAMLCWYRFQWSMRQTAS